MSYGEFSTPLAITGYLLTIIGYFGKSFTELPTITIAFGLVLLISGYAFLLMGSLRKLREEAEEELLQKKEGFTTQEAKEKSSNYVYNSELFTKLGYGLLFAFFFGILIIPKITYTVRYYDPLAATGYGLGLINKMNLFYMPVFLPYFFLTLYYILGSYIKIEEEGWVNKLQLVSRMILAIYYGLNILGIH